jgi:hypothetical protein
MLVGTVGLKPVTRTPGLNAQWVEQVVVVITVVLGVVASREVPAVRN